MTMYIVKGFGYDGCGVGIEIYAEPYMNQEIAELRLEEIAKDQAYLCSMYDEDDGPDKVDYHEVFRYKNGHLELYTLEKHYDLSSPKQKEIFLADATPTNCKIDDEEFCPKLDHPLDALRTLIVSRLEIRCQEVKPKMENDDKK